MLDGLIKGFGAASLENHSLVRQACVTRNSTITYGGVTPLELAFGHRPRDIVTPENSDPAQLTGEPADGRPKGKGKSKSVGPGKGRGKQDQQRPQ